MTKRKTKAPEPPATVKERIIASIKHGRGRMAICVVIDPEDEAEAKAIFQKLGRRAGKVTYRVKRPDE